MPSSMHLREQHREQIPIAQLQPSTPTDSSAIVGIVALIWPFSSSKKTFSLLLVEPDFRLRRERGQVHVEFSGPSAKAVAGSGVEIGDQVSLDLVGVEWTKDATNPATPGKGIDWGLRFQQRLWLQISRSSQEPILVEIDHPTPSPEPQNRSPIPAFPNSLARSISRPDSESGSQVWASPAFLKRSHLAYATYLKKQYDPFLDEDVFEKSGREKKLKLGRKDYQWKLADTTPSPENEIVASGSGRRDSASPARVQDAEHTILSSAIVQSNPMEQDEPLNQSNESNQTVSENEKDKVMSDEISDQHLPEVISQAKVDDNDYGLGENTLPNGARHKPPNQEPNVETYTEGVDGQNARAEINVNEMQEEDVSQILPENEPSTPHSRDSSIVRVSVTNDITDESSPQKIDGRGDPGRGKDGPESQPEMNEDSMEDERLQETRSEDEPSTLANRDSSVHRPTEDMGNLLIQRSRVSTQEKRISPSKSPESSVEIRSTSSGSVSGLNSPTGAVSEDQSGSDAEYSSDLGDEVSLISPVQGPHSDQDYFSDDPSEIDSGDEVVSIGSDSDSAAEDTQSIHSAEDENELLNTASAAEGVLDDNLGFELDGPSILQTRSRPSTLLLPRQRTHQSGIISNELEMLLPLIDPNIGGLVGPRGEALAVNAASFTKPVNAINTKNATPEGDIAKAKDINEIQDDSGSITNEPQEEDSTEIEASHQNRAPDTMSAQINADRTGESSGVDRESTIIVLPERQDRPSRYDKQEPENGISSGEDDSYESLDDNKSQPQQDNETQIIRPTKPTVDIIDLESESEDDDVPASPLTKASPAHGSGKATRFVFEHIAVYKQEDDLSESDGPSLDLSNENKVADVVIEDAPVTASAVQDDLHDIDSPTYHMMAQSTGPNTPSKDHSRVLQDRIFRGQDSKLNAEVEDSPQSKMSELEDEIFRDSDLDPIFRKQLFTPSASQQRSLVSEPSAVSIKNQQDEYKLPTPRLTQSVSAPPLPPATPEPQQNPSLVEKIKALKDRSAKAAHARKSIDPVAASTWFTHKEKSQLTHISDTEVESERESAKSSNQFPLIHEDPQSQGPVKSSHPKINTHPVPEQEVLAPKPDPFPAGFRTSLAYYAPLSTISSHFNTLTSVLAIVHSSTPLKRSNSSPRDFYQSLSLTDPSSASYSPITTQIFRPKEVAFPATNPGDAILLRNFKVQSFSGRLGLLSTDSSAWAVFRNGEDVQVRGPPVEFGAEERGFARGLWSWWGSIREGKAKVIERKDEEEAVQQPEAKTKSGKANLRSSAGRQTPRRTRRHQQDNSSESVLHELRDGTSYTDSTPEKGTRRKKTDAHELRDGTTYTDIDSDGEVARKKGRGKAKKGGAKEKMKLNHKLRDGTTYSDDLE